MYHPQTYRGHVIYILLSWVPQILKTHQRCPYTNKMGTNMFWIDQVPHLGWPMVHDTIVIQLVTCLSCMVGSSNRIARAYSTYDYDNTKMNVLIRLHYRLTHWMVLTSNNAICSISFSFSSYFNIITFKQSSRIHKSPIKFGYINSKWIDQAAHRIELARDSIF